MKPLKFIHITKTAGTTIEDEAKKHSILWGRHHKEYGWHHGLLKHKSPTMVEKYDWFTVVRNPYTRIISEFHCRFGGMNRSPKKMLEFSNGDFNNYLIKRISNHNSGRDRHGGHYTPQHYYTDNEIPITILKFENIKHEFDALMKKYKLLVSLNSCKNTNPKIFYISDMNQKLRDLINAVYEKDFEHFNYSSVIN